MANRAGRGDVDDVDFVDAQELSADGLTDYRTDTIATCTSSTKLVVLSGSDRVDNPSELPVQVGDILVITGSSAADGTYTIAVVPGTLAGLTVEVVETIPDSTGGTAHFRYPTGSRQVGVNPTGLTNVTASNVQQAIAQLDAAITGGGITATAHRTLLQLIHFLDDGPALGFASGAYKEVVGGIFPTEIRWKRADTTLLLKKTITRSGGGATNITPTPVVWQLYAADGTTVLETVSDAITYSGAYETGRVRAIS